MKMTDRHRGASHDRHDDDIYDDYSDDFDDDDGDTSNRRYKTRSPLNRTDNHSRGKDSRSSDSKLLNYGSIRDSSRPPASMGNNTHRKARGGMSLASGYFTPTRKSAVSIRSDPDTVYDRKMSPRQSKNSLKTDYLSNSKKDGSTVYTPSVYDTPRAKSYSPQKKVFQKRGTASSIYAAKSDRSNRGGRGRGRGRFSQMGRSSQEPHIDNIAKRVLSARRLKINEMANMNQDLNQQLKDLKAENKLLKKVQHRTDKALQKFEDRESELPQLIQRQNNEVRSYKDQIRKWREKFEKTDRYLRDAEDDLEKVKIKMKKLKSLADEKELPERSELNKKLNNAELDMEAKDVKIKELERHIQNLEKNHKHELGIERARSKEVQKQLAQLRDDNEQLSTQVKEKDKEISMKNMYVQERRAAQKPPHRLPNSYNGTPQGTPPPRRRRPSLSEADKPTPRERAKMMEEKRREELRRQREMKMEHDKVKQAEALRKAREEDEHRERQRQEHRRRDEQELAEKERRLNEQMERDAADRRAREERERLKLEAKEREQREREKREREERDRRREQEERDRRERERLEQERRAAEERRRFEDDVTLQSERKKKDEILQKLREIDEGGAAKKKEKEKPKDTINDPFFMTQNKESSADSIASSKKSYTFTKPTENLHKGKPSHKEGFNSNTSFTVGAGRKTNRTVNDLESGGYNPTFGSSQAGSSSKPATKTFSLFDDDKPSSPTQAKPANKTRLMEDLFGSSSKNDGPKHNDIFATPKPAKRNPGRSSGFPWDDEGSSNKNQSSSLFKSTRENSSTLFGGGSALINDEDLQKSQARTQGGTGTLPRRPKQTTTTFSSRPTVNAVDHFDDDIEEVIL